MANNVSVLYQGAAIAYTSGTDLGGQTFTKPYDGCLRLTVSFSAAQKLILRVNGVNLPMNSDSALVANALYAFCANVPGGITFSIRFDGSGTVNMCVLEYAHGSFL